MGPLAEWLWLWKRGVTKPWAKLTTLFLITGGPKLVAHTSRTDYVRTLEGVHMFLSVVLLTMRHDPVHYL